MPYDFRIVAQWNATGEVFEQYYYEYDALEAVIEILEKAIDNGCQVAYVAQEWVEGKGPETFQSNGTVIGRIPWKG